MVYKNVTALVNAQYKEQHAIHELLKQTIKQINKETVTETESNLFSQMQKQVPQHMLSCVIFIASQDMNLHSAVTCSLSLNAVLR